MSIRFNLDFATSPSEIRLSAYLPPSAREQALAFQPLHEELTGETFVTRTVHRSRAVQRPNLAFAPELPPELSCLADEVLARSETFISLTPLSPIPQEDLCGSYQMFTRPTQSTEPCIVHPAPPLDRLGVPMTLCAHIDCGEVFALGGGQFGLPKTGSLSFYISKTDDAFGADSFGDSAVVYLDTTATPGIFLDRWISTHPQLECTCNPVFGDTGSARFQPRITSMPPLMADDALECLFKCKGLNPFSVVMDQRLIDTYRDTLDRQGSSMFATPNFLGTPPEIWDDSMICLLEPDSTDGTDGLNDCGIGHFLISKKDFAAGDFGQCIFTWTDTE
ncbi:MAG: DUF1963 domain-containing protein [Pseudomonadota bacterium]